VLSYALELGCVATNEFGVVKIVCKTLWQVVEVIDEYKTDEEAVL